MLAPKKSPLPSDSFLPEKSVLPPPHRFICILVKQAKRGTDTIRNAGQVRREAHKPVIFGPRTANILVEIDHRIKNATILGFVDDNVVRTLSSEGSGCCLGSLHHAANRIQLFYGETQTCPSQDCVGCVNPTQHGPQSLVRESRPASPGTNHHFEPVDVDFETIKIPECVVDEGQLCHGHDVVVAETLIGVLKPLVCDPYSLALVPDRFQTVFLAAETGRSSRGH